MINEMNKPKTKGMEKSKIVEEYINFVTACINSFTSNLFSSVIALLPEFTQYFIYLWFLLVGLFGKVIFTRLCFNAGFI